MLFFKNLFYYLAVVVGVLAIVITLLSLIYGVSIWWIKVLDFLRQQVFILCLLCLLVFSLINKRWSFWPVLFCGGLLFSAGVQAYIIYPYTHLVPPKVAWATVDSASAENTVSIMIANVYMKNRNANSFLRVISKANPDMVLTMETDQWWERALQPLKGEWPYYMEYPLDNTYGMLLYSKFPLKDTVTQFFQHDDVPSFHAKVELPSGAHFYFHGMHPVPPIKSKYPDNIGQEEEELLEAGKIVAAQPMPAIVAGDFNDVAWSNTSRLFQVKNQLNDLRIGRGFYNTFNAHFPVMRWPLDHVYVTDEFEVVDMQRLAKFGSDHFPICVKLRLRKAD